MFLAFIDAFEQASIRPQSRRKAAFYTQTPAHAWGTGGKFREIY
jgi:hypothetical protein